jgi:hypothetical protein
VFVGITYNQFLRLWHICFPHVRVREYKQCCGKCLACMTMSESRRKTGDPRKKKYLTMLHSLHRTMYMGERLSYAARRTQAVEEPEKYLSSIADGMAQNHCLLPYFANKYTVSLYISHFS